MRAVCRETAFRPVPPEESEAFGRLWIDPYERWAPRWAYVARADVGVTGYLTGCAGTAAFLAASMVLGPRPTLSATLGFPPLLLLKLLARYPAHLHVNVLQAHRGGAGRALIQRFEADLAAAGVAGVHAFCGERPLGFYLKLGYAELARRKRGDAWIYAVGKRLRGLASV